MKKDYMKEKAELKEACKGVIDWLNKNSGTPFLTVVIGGGKIELLQCENGCDYEIVD